MQLVAHEPVVLAPLLAPTVFSNFNGLHSFTPRQHQHLSLVPRWRAQAQHILYSM